MENYKYTTYNIDRDHPMYKRVTVDQWGGICYSVPKECMKKAVIEYKDVFNKPCVYVLSEHNHDAVYIGHTDNFEERIKSHMTQKTFWDIAIIFTNKTFTKAHVGWVESELVKDLINLKHQGNQPKGTYLPDEDIPGAKTFKENVQYLLLSAFGLINTFNESIPIPVAPTSVPVLSLQPVATKNTKSWVIGQTYPYINKNGVNVNLLMKSQTEYVLLEGSIIRGEPTNSFQNINAKAYYEEWKRITQDKQMTQEIVINTIKSFKTLIDIPFTSPSAALVVSCASSMNGNYFLKG
jgi:hypothetical protein